MTERRRMCLCLMIVVISAFFFAPIATHHPGGASASPDLPVPVWEPGTFEDNIDLTYTPTQPAPAQAVNITIVSKDTPIQSATVNIEWFAPSGDHSSGAYVMNAVADTSYMQYRGKIPDTINLYPGITVIFYVTAWDFNSAALTSKNYTYTVTNEGGWKYTGFENNIQLYYSPQQPQPYGIVNISIAGREAGVKFKAVQVSLMYQPPDGDWVGPFSVEYKNLSDVAGYALIGVDPKNTPNQPGYNVTFWVAVYDKYYVKIESQHISYSINETFNPNPDRYSFFTVVVYDDNEGRLVSGALVEIKNKTRTISGQTNQFGWYIPIENTTGNVVWLLLGDTYTVSVKYKSILATAKYTFSVDLEANKTLLAYKDYKVRLYKGSLEYHFKISAVVMTFESFPQQFMYPFCIGAIIAPVLTAWYLYYKQEEERKRLTEEKKKLGHIQKDKGGLGQHLWEAFERETKRPHAIKPIAFFATGLFGMAFTPFYPWWMTLLLASLVGIISYRFPYLSLIVLSLTVTAACGYQSPEFGLVWLVFSLIILICGFFDWKFSLLVFLAVFTGRFGLPFAIPVFTAILYSGFLAVAVAATSLTFLTFVVTCGNVTILGFFTGVKHINALPMFSLPIKQDFVPTDIGTAFAGIGNADSEYMNTIVTNNFGASIAPFLLIVLWCLAFYLIGLIVDKKGAALPTLGRWLKHPFTRGKSGALAGCAMALVVSSATLSMYAQGMFSGMRMYDLIGTGVLAVCTAIGIYTCIVAAMITREVFAEWYTSQIGVSAIGTRISDMQALGKTTFEMVGGLHDVKQDLKESMIVPLLRPDISEQFGIEPAKGIMLFGPPGCGKTLLMKALATELHVEMINIKCSDIMSKWYGESESRITELFKTAKERKPCIIFFDEIDAIAKKRELYSADDVTPRLLSIMLSELDGMDRAAGIIMVGSTNKPEMCDAALMRPGRFDKIMYVPPPGYEERLDVFRVHLQGKPIDEDINLHELAKRTERFSGADIANLVKEAATIGMRRSMETGKFTMITNDDFMAILPRMKPSISLSMKEEYEKIKARYERKMHDLYRTEKKSSVTWDDVADMQEIKQELHEFIELPLQKHEVVEQFRIRTGKGLLLFGPPDCGKTYIMKAAANKFNIHMQVINTADLVNSLVTEGENAMREIFVKARDTAPSLILFVELEMLMRRPEGEATNSTMREMFVQNQLLSAIDNLHSSDKVIVVATTDHPDTIAPDFFRPGRFDKAIYIPPPNIEARSEMFRVMLHDIPKNGEIDYATLADKTEGFSAEDIYNVVNEAKLLSIQESFYGVTEPEKQDDGTNPDNDSKENGENNAENKKGGANCGVNMEELLRAIAKTKPSVSQEIVRRCEKFRDTFNK